MLSMEEFFRKRVQEAEPALPQIWYSCKYCSRAFKDVEKLLEHKGTNHKGELLGPIRPLKRRKCGPRSKTCPEREIALLPKELVTESLGNSSKEDANNIGGIQEETETIASTVHKKDESSDRKEELVGPTKPLKKRKCGPRSKTCPEREIAALPKELLTETFESSTKEDTNNNGGIPEVIEIIASEIHRSEDDSESDNPLMERGRQNKSKSIHVPVQIQCEICWKLFTTRRGMKTHMNRIHQRNQQSAKVSSENGEIYAHNSNTTTNVEDASPMLEETEDLNLEACSESPGNGVAPVGVSCVFCHGRFAGSEYGEHRKKCKARLDNSFVKKYSTFTANIEAALNVNCKS